MAGGRQQDLIHVLYDDQTTIFILKEELKIKIEELKDKIKEIEKLKCIIQAKILETDPRDKKPSNILYEDKDVHSHLVLLSRYVFTFVFKDFRVQASLFGDGVELAIKMRDLHMTQPFTHDIA